MAKLEIILLDPTKPEDQSVWKALICVLGVLVLVLSIIFFKSFDPKYVLFANDAPLGALISQEQTAMQNFSGAWQPLNWIGSEHPSALPSVTYAFYLIFGALAYIKFFVPFALLFLGLCIWFFFRQIGFSSSTSVLAGLAGALNTEPLSMACWGLPPIVISMASTFGAMGMIVSTPKGQSWIKYCLTGAWVGMGVMEGYDVGAILSLYVAAFILFQAWMEHKTAPKAIRSGGFRLAIVALFAVLLAAAALATLIGTQIKGIAGTQQDQESKDQRWTEATLWSLPKIETLRVIVPGLFGYRMDTAAGGNYWGGVGQQPGWEEHHQGQSRYSGTGIYAGVLVTFLAAWALFRSFKRPDAVFSERDRKFIWFWGAMALLSLLFAFGWHAPFYRFIYHLPYFSTIRNPIKFMHPFSIAVIVLFGYGLEGLRRLSSKKETVGKPSLGGQFKLSWASVPKPERSWIIGSIIFLAASLIGTLIFISSRAEIERYLNNGGFPNELASQIFYFGAGELEWYLLFLALSVILVALILCGFFSGVRIKWAILLLGTLLVSDLIRADAPWIIYYDYHEKYATNPVLEMLREKPYEHRITGRFIPFRSEPSLLNDPNVSRIYYEWWMQHLFQYYRIQSLDIIQMPRAPEMDSAYLRNFAPTSETNLFPIVRLWQLTDTRYQIEEKGFADFLNRVGDPLKKGFRIHTAFDFVPRSDIVASSSGLKMEDITTAIKPDGRYAIAEFTGALPRAKLFANWQNVPDEGQTLKILANPSFDPQQTVLVMDVTASTSTTMSTNTDAGKVEITSYTPKHVELKTQAKSSTVLLLNDRYAPDWKVMVDGITKPSLRCNFIMRGVQLSPGEHRVEFVYRTDVKALYLSLATIAISLVFSIVLLLRARVV